MGKSRLHGAESRFEAAWSFCASLLCHAALFVTLGNTSNFDPTIGAMNRFDIFWVSPSSAAQDDRAARDSRPDPMAPAAQPVPAGSVHQPVPAVSDHQPEQPAGKSAPAQAEETESGVTPGLPPTASASQAEVVAGAPEAARPSQERDVKEPQAVMAAAVAPPVTNELPKSRTVAAPAVKERSVSRTPAITAPGEASLKRAMTATVVQEPSITGQKTIPLRQEPPAPEAQPVAAAQEPPAAPVATATIAREPPAAPATTVTAVKEQPTEPVTTKTAAKEPSVTPTVTAAAAREPQVAPALTAAAIQAPAAPVKTVTTVKTAKGPLPSKGRTREGERREPRQGPAVLNRPEPPRPGAAGRDRALAASEGRSGAPGAQQTGTGREGIAARPEVPHAPTVKPDSQPKSSGKAPEPRGIVVSSLRGDLKMVITGQSGIKLQVSFREYPKSRRNRMPTKAEARREQRIVPVFARTRQESREAVIETAWEGIYQFSAESEPGETVQASFTLKIFETGAGEKVIDLGTRTVSGRVLLAKILMREGILWDDPSAFTGSLEDSDSITKFNAHTGLYWKEYHE